MKISKLEKRLDDYLAKDDGLDNREIDNNWTNAAEQLEKLLAKESSSIDKKTMIRMLSKSISAFNKLLIRDAIRSDLNLEQIVKHRIDDFGYSQKIIDTLPQSIRKELAKKGGDKRNVKINERRAEVVAHWLEHIYPKNPKLSNEKIGERLLDFCPELSSRKLSEYIATAKRDLQKTPPASKA